MDRFHRIIDLFRRSKQPPIELPPDKLLKEIERNREITLQRCARFKRLLGDNTLAWNEFKIVIQDYIDLMRLKKLQVSLDRADQGLINVLKLMDREIYILEWVLRIPNQFIDSTNKMMEGIKQEEAKLTEDL
jgi:hypothetical protein